VILSKIQVEHNGNLVLLFNEPDGVGFLLNPIYGPTQSLAESQQVFHEAVE